MKFSDLKDARIDVGTPCIEGKPGDKRGYVGTGHGRYEHRKAWARVNGPIPPGLEIDHLCRNRACINPAHLEAVTHSENVRRSYVLITECKYGHPYNSENRFVHRTTGSIRCRPCKREYDRRGRERRKHRFVLLFTEGEWAGV